ncbi:MAG: peptide chain release factor N(5)-glutamine methyltransferase [Alphaproteobacteria bacterium]|nr:peptide chain release factor N(5)-glutamine methyltransferase [Alphaproteobacteria bacterium]
MKLGELLTSATAILTKAGIETPRLDARLLIAEAIGKNPSFILMHDDYSVSVNEEEKISSFIARRAQREPVSRIIGVRDFWKLSFCLNEDTLDPRPDSETLVEAVVHSFAAQTQPLNILDLGTGTGCLLLALLSELKTAKGLGIDISPKAIAAAKANADRNGLSAKAEFIAASWHTLPANAVKTYDIIISNPPYIPQEELSSLAPEVRCFDPEAALNGGEDGLTAYREISLLLPSLLCEKGSFFCEIGKGQEDDVTAIMTSAGLHLNKMHKDFGGITRCLHFQK